MKTTICIISTYLNHHNKPICDAFYELTGGHFWYIATSNISEMRKKMGFSQIVTGYLLDYTIEDKRNAIQEVIDSADVVLIGASESIRLISKRLKHKKLTFRCSERLFKTRSRYLKAPIYWIRSFLTRNCYLLCNSAASSRDYNLLGFYKNKCYKWGYFTEVVPFDYNQKWDSSINPDSKHSCVSILWVGRLIKLKHPEVAIKALKAIRDIGFKFNFNIIGDGPMAPSLHELIDSFQLNNCIHMLGAKSNADVRKYMEKSEVFLFTSNREEGWGAVLYEAMSCACAVIANSEIGSVPLLLNNGVNGLVYEKDDLTSLIDCILKLIRDPGYRCELGKEAYRTILDYWTPRVAADNFIQLVQDIHNGQESSIEYGPCSRA